MSATLLVLTLMLLVIGVGYLCAPRWTKRSVHSVVGLCLLNASGISAACYGAATSL